MSSLRSVRAAVASILATETRLDVLVDNAGAIYRHAARDGRRHRGDARRSWSSARSCSRPGCLPLLEATPGSRVIAVTSGGMYTQRLPLDDLGYRSGAYAGPKAYARAKRAQVALVREWSRRMRRACRVRGDAPGLGGHAGTRGVAARLLPGDAPAACAHRRRGSTRSCGWRRTPTPPAIDGRLFLDRRSRPFDRVPSTRLAPARPAPAVGPRRRRSAGGEDPAPGALIRPRRPPTSLGHGGGRLDHAVRDPHGARHRPRLGRRGRRAADGDQRHAAREQLRDHERRRGAVVRRHHADHRRPRPRPGHRVHPPVDRHVRSQVQDADAAPAQRRREGQRAELMARPGREPDDHRHPARRRLPPGTTAASRRSTAWLAACSPPTLSRPAAHASPSAAAAGSRTASTTDSNEPDASISSRAASVSAAELASAAATNRWISRSRWARAERRRRAAAPAPGDGATPSPGRPRPRRSPARPPRPSSPSRPASAWRRAPRSSSSS